jgi:hypothetical protein
MRLMGSVCWRMLTYADVCWRVLLQPAVTAAMLTYAMLTYADVCFSNLQQMPGGLPQVFDGHQVLSLLLILFALIVKKYKYWRQRHCVPGLLKPAAYADVCWRMLTYADVCWRMLAYADVDGQQTFSNLQPSLFALLVQKYKYWRWRACQGLSSLQQHQRMLTYAHVCSRMLTYADLQQQQQAHAAHQQQHMLTYAYWKQAYADVCWLKAGVCSRMLTESRPTWRISSSLHTWRHSSSSKWCPQLCACVCTCACVCVCLSFCLSLSVCLSVSVCVLYMYVFYINTHMHEYTEAALQYIWLRYIASTYTTLHYIIKKMLSKYKKYSHHTTT